MLVLRRKQNESIMIGDDVKVTVVEIGSKFVKLGFTAPEDIPIHRQEVYEARQSQVTKEI